MHISNLYFISNHTRLSNALNCISFTASALWRKKGRFLNLFMVHGEYRFISHYHNCDAQKDSLCGYHRSVVFSDFDSLTTCNKSIFTVIYSIYWVKSHQIQVVSWSDLWWLTDEAILCDNRNVIKTVISSIYKGKFLLIEVLLVDLIYIETILLENMGVR